MGVREGFLGEALLNWSWSKRGNPGRRRTHKGLESRSHACWRLGKYRVPQGSWCLPRGSNATLHQGTGLPAWWAAPHTICEKTLLFIVLKPSLASHASSVTKPCSHLPPKYLSSLPTAASSPGPQPLSGDCLCGQAPPLPPAHHVAVRTDIWKRHSWHLTPY